MYFVPCTCQEKEVQFRESMHKLRTKVGEWEEKSKDLLHGFLGLFGRDGRIVSDSGVLPWGGGGGGELDGQISCIQ